MTDFLKARLQHVFDVRIEFGKDRTVFGPMPGGASQGYTPPKSGVISGPKLQGTVVPHSGADYATVRPDGVVELNAHYLLKADDGTLIYIENHGYLVMAGDKGKPNDQGLPQPHYFKFTPKFRVPEGPHDWLMRTVIVGSGERRKDPDHSIFRYYAVK
jgi:hypothetical protein